jgi:hypothetical protein
VRSDSSFCDEAGGRKRSANIMKDADAGFLYAESKAAR